MNYGRNYVPNDESTCFRVQEHRNGLLCGIYDRLKAGDRFSGKQILAEAQWRLDSLISGDGFPAYQVVLGSNSADFFGRGAEDEDLAAARDTSLSGQFVQQWKLGTTAQERALREIANCRLRRLLACNKSFTCADVEIGDALLSLQVQGKKITPRRRGPALISDVDVTSATVKFLSRISKVARICVRKQGEEKDAEDAELDPVQARLRQSGAGLHAEKDLEVDRGPGNSSLGTGTPERCSGPRPEMIPVPDAPSVGPIAVSACDHG